MTFDVKINRLYRKLLTPLRKYLLIKKFRQRCPLDTKQYNYELVQIENRGLQTFAVLLKIGSNYTAGMVLRCGCYFEGSGKYECGQALNAHNKYTEHKQRIIIGGIPFENVLEVSSGGIKYTLPKRATRTKTTTPKPDIKPVAQKRIRITGTGIGGGH